MSYHLRVTHEEVREELSLLGFTNVAEETVEILRKDLLKLIKSDLSKIKQKRKQENDQNIRDCCAISGKHHIYVKKIPRLQEKFTPVISEPHAVFMQKFSIRSLNGYSSQTSANEDKSDEESGYSDFGSTTSTTFESYNERSECSSALYTSDYYASKAELPEEETKTISSESKRQKQKIKETQYRELSVESGKVSTSSFKGPTAYQEHGRSKVKQVVGRQKVTKVARDKDTLPVYPGHPDPVSLYHYYKAQWEKFKVPGEDPRSKLRWAVRTRLFYSK